MLRPINPTIKNRRSKTSAMTGAVAMIYANFKAQRDGVLESGFLRFYGTAAL